MTYTEASFLLTMVKHAAEKQRCKLADIGLDNQIIHPEGPAKNKTECALATAGIPG